MPSSTAWIQPVVGGITVGIMAYFVPEVLGVGYNEVERVLGGNVVLHVVILLAVLKLVATAVCYASGNAGGIFGPSLFLGAMVGAAVGSVAHALAPTVTAGPGAYALVGMGALFAGVIRTPLTSVFMVFEITRDYSIVVPLMISNLLAFYISRRLQHEPIYEALARQDGLHLPKHAGENRNVMRPVTRAIRESPVPIPHDATVVEAAHRVEGISLESWPVTDEDGLVGMVRTQAIQDAAAKGSNVTIAELIADEVADEHPVHVHTDHPLSVALARMGESGHDVLPVVSRANGRLLLGLVTLKDVLKAYGVS